MINYKIIESIHMTKEITETVERTWKERLFSLPWRPFQKTKEIKKSVASDKVMIDNTNQVIYCHPSFAHLISRNINRYYSNFGKCEYYNDPQAIK
jgi:hypothetical protein